MAAPVVIAPPPAAPPAPALVRVRQQLPAAEAGSGDDYGAFSYADDWQLTGGQQGVIVQEITRTLVIKYKDTNQVILESVINRWANNVNFHLDCMHYWECFPVSAEAAGEMIGQQGIIADHFQSAAFRPPESMIRDRGVKGTYTITGKARFYPTALDPNEVDDRAQLGLGRVRDNVAMANGLVSTAASPGAALARLFPTMAGVSNEVTRTVTTTWDSAENNFGDSVITIT